MKNTVSKVFSFLGGLLIIFFTMITNYRIWTNFALVVCPEYTVVSSVLSNWQKSRRSKKLVWLRGIQSSTFGSWKICDSSNACLLCRLPRKTMKNWRDRAIGFLILGTPGLLIALQPDMGSTQSI